MEPEHRLPWQASIDRPRLSLPEGKRVAVFLAVKVERCDINRAMPRQALAHMAARPGVLFWQDRQIMDWYIRVTS
jgi:allantoinase